MRSLCRSVATPTDGCKALSPGGDLSGVRAAAVELERRVNLTDALSIVLLMAAKRDPAYERAAAKWLLRFARERPQAGLDDLKIALDALLLLRDGRTQAHHALRMLAGRQRLGDVIGLTDPPGTPDNAKRSPHP